MSKTILITNGRFPATLDLIRNLSRGGHKVIVAETSLYHYCSTSKATAKNVLIPSPRECEEGYILKILQVIEEEKVDFFLPAWEDVLVVSKHLDRFPKGVAFTSEYQVVHALHNKWEFSKLLTRLGYPSPSTFLVNSQVELDSVPFDAFYIKACYSRGSESAYFVDRKENIPKIQNPQEFPLLVQEKIEGNQFCTYSICHNGKVTAHATYPLHYAKYDGSKTRGTFCLSFEEVKHKKIYALVEEIAQKINYTGSLAFDIFENGDKLSILECNPRLTSGVTLLTSQDRLADAYFNTIEKTLHPIENEQTQLLFPSILFATKKSIKNGSFRPFIKTLFNAKDVIFHKNDMKPFFFQPVIGIHNLLLKFKYKKSVISSYSHDLDYEER
ncbi:MAG: hypothetical protein SP1CHLAM9_11450 [Chlamydiia bacterium]|nr:hypothetical protein [Chlamydiia bacterium]